MHNIIIPHAYDIDLVKSYKSFERMANYHIKDNEPLRQAVVNHAKQICMLYCVTKKLNFDDFLIKDKPLIYVDNAACNNCLEIVLPLALVSYDIFQLFFFLDYQRANVYKGRRDFIEMIQIEVYNQVATFAKSFQCSSVQAIRMAIMTWVNTRKNEANKVKPSSTHIKNKTEGGNMYLEWEKGSLKNLSKEMWEKGYTQKAKDFEKVFTKKEKCNWLKGSASLAYFIEQLYNNGYYIIMGSKSNAYFKVSELYFCDLSGKVAKNFKLKSALYNFSNRPSAAHANIKNDIDFIIRNIK